MIQNLLKYIVSVLFSAPNFLQLKLNLILFKNLQIFYLSIHFKKNMRS